MVPPATTPHGSAWTASQREVLRLVLEEHVNVQITGEPGAGKTEVASALMVRPAGGGGGLYARLPLEYDLHVLSAEALIDTRSVVEVLEVPKR